MNFFIFLLMFFFAFNVKAESVLDVTDIKNAILSVHKISKGKDRGDRILWYNCGKRLNETEANTQAELLARYIYTSIMDVHETKFVVIDYRIVIAVLFKESSHDSCSIGRQELKRYNVESFSMKEILVYTKRWKTFLDRNESLKEVSYFDVGIAQYRFPKASFKGRTVKTIEREITSIKIEDLFKPDVSIQLLVEDLAQDRLNCEGHNHRWKHKKIDVENVFFIHHHSDIFREVYWIGIKRILKIIEKI